MFSLTLGVEEADLGGYAWNCCTSVLNCVVMWCALIAGAVEARQVCAGRGRRNKISMQQFCMHVHTSVFTCVYYITGDTADELSAPEGVHFLPHTQSERGRSKAVGLEDGELFHLCVELHCDVVCSNCRCCEGSSVCRTREEDRLLFMYIQVCCVCIKYLLLWFDLL